MTLRAGALNRRVQVQKRASGLDGYGQPSETWVDLFGHKLWASIEPLGGRELIAAKAVQAESTHTISVRYRPELVVANATAYRVLYGGKVYNIQNIDDPETRHEYLTMLCSEGVNKG